METKFLILRKNFVKYKIRSIIISGHNKKILLTYNYDKKELIQKWKDTLNHGIEIIDLTPFMNHPIGNSYINIDFEDIEFFDTLKQVEIYTY